MMPHFTTTPDIKNMVKEDELKGTKLLCVECGWEGFIESKDDNGIRFFFVVSHKCKMRTESISTNF